MANNLVLSKDSSESDIRSYFKGVLELSKSNDDFPVNLDEVWMLVYPRKDHAVRELTEGGQFIQNIDYQVFLKNGENPKGGRPTNIYMLSVPCLEYFIARKIRTVFEVYRQVFHRVAQNPAQLSRKELALMVVQAEEEKERMKLENLQIKRENELKQDTIDRQSEELTKAAPKVNYYDSTLQSVNTMTTTQVAKSIGMETHALNKKLKEIGVQFKQSSMWMLHAPYSSWKLTSTRTQMYTRSDGSTGTSQYTVWNERGRRFIVALSQNGWDVKKAIKEINGEKIRSA